MLALETAERAGDLVAIAWGLQRFAITEVEVGDPILGARLAGAAWSARQRSGGTFPPPFMPIEDPEVRARAAIGPEADWAFAAGKELGLLEAVGLARGSGASG